MPKRSETAKRRPVPKVRIAKPSGRPFQVRYRDPCDGKEKRVSVGSRDAADAERLKAEVEAKLVLGISDQALKKVVCGPEMPWPDFRERYRTDQLANLRAKSAEDAESRLDIAERIIRPQSLGDLADPATLGSLQTRLLAGEASTRKRPRSTHTVRGYMGSILAALRWAYDLGWLNEVPRVRKVRAAKGTAMKGRPITDAEFAKMLRCVESVVGPESADSWRYLMRGVWESGLRISEAMHLSWDIPGTIQPQWENESHPVLVIPAHRQKNNANQQIPILPGFQNVLLETPSPARIGWIFEPGSLQRRIGRPESSTRPNTEWVGRVISRIGRKADVIVTGQNEQTGQPPKFASAHDLRRSFGQRLRTMGVPPLVLGRVMRHSSVETTLRHYAPGDVQADAAALWNASDGNAKDRYEAG